MWLPYRTILIFCLQLVLCLSVMAQSAGEITIKVYDEEENPVEAAQAIIRSGDKVLAFGSTNSKGLCQLVVNKSADAQQLTVRLLGYTAVQKTLAQVEMGQQVEVQLTPTSYELEEVVVKEKLPPMIDRQDTLIYNGDSYRDGTEDNVEELVSKMPGVEIEENGKITIMGKQVDKVLIEGDDVFGHNYHIGTKNISADLIERVEFIDDYSDDPVLKGIEESNLMAMNLTLKAGRKRFAFGEAELSHGFAGASDNQLNVFALRKKTKAFLVASNNNIGRPTLPISSVNIMSGQDFTTAERGMNRDGLLQIPWVSEPTVLDEERYHNNASYQGSIVLLSKPSKRFRIRTMLYGAQEDNQLGNMEATRFFLSGDTLELTSRDQWTRENRPLHLETRATYRIKDNARIALRYEWQRSRNQVQTRALSQTALGPDTLQTTFTGLANSHFLDISYAQRFNSLMALTIQVTGKVEDTPQQVDYFAGRYQEPSALGIQGEQLLQDVSLDNSNYSSQVRLLYNDGKWTGNVSVGGQFSRHSMRSDLLQGTADRKKESLGSAFQNDAIYQIREGTIGLQLRRQFGDLQIGAQLRGSLVDFNIDNAPQETTMQDQSFFVQPSLRLDYTLSRRSRLQATASRSVRPARYSNLLSGQYLRDYRTLYAGLDSLYYMRSNNLGLKYRFRNSFKLMTFHVSYQYTAVPITESQSINVGPWLDRLQVFLTGGSRSHILRLGFDKYLSALKTNLDVNVDALQSLSDNNLGGVAVRSRVRTLNTDLELGYGGSEHWRPFAGLGFRVQNFNNAGDAEQVNLARSRRWELSGGVTYRNPDILTIKLEAQAVRWQQRNLNSSALFLDSQVNVPIKKGLIATLDGRNLLNQDDLTVSTAGLYQENQIRYLLRSRIIMAGIRWKF